jgi:hypothetical protein
MSNDDNYYLPGYFEQMVRAGANADLVSCPFLHSYFAWTAGAAGTDLGAWIARRSLIRSVPWTGTEFDADQKYLAAIKEVAGPRVATVNRALFVHN